MRQRPTEPPLQLDAHTLWRLTQEELDRLLSTSIGALQQLELSSFVKVTPQRLAAQHLHVVLLRALCVAAAAGHPTFEELTDLCQRSLRPLLRTAYLVDDVILQLVHDLLDTALGVYEADQPHECVAWRVAWAVRQSLATPTEDCWPVDGTLMLPTAASDYAGLEPEPNPLQRLMQRVTSTLQQAAHNVENTITTGMDAFIAAMHAWPNFDFSRHAARVAHRCMTTSLHRLPVLRLALQEVMRSMVLTYETARCHPAQLEAPLRQAAEQVTACVIRDSRDEVARLAAVHAVMKTLPQLHWLQQHAERLDSCDPSLPAPSSTLAVVSLMDLQLVDPTASLDAEQLMITRNYMVHMLMGVCHLTWTQACKVMDVDENVIEQMVRVEAWGY